MKELIPYVITAIAGVGVIYVGWQAVEILIAVCYVIFVW